MIEHMRTEKATPKKLQRAREEGDLPKSFELAFALLFTSGVGLLWGMRDLFGKGVQEVYESIFTEFTLRPVLVPWLMCLFGLMGVAIAVHLIQTGWVWAPKAASFRWRQRKRQLRPFYFILKTLAIGVVGYLVLKRVRPHASLFLSQPLKQVDWLFHELFFLGLALSLILLIFGIFDFFYQRWAYERRMRMTKAEIKQEQHDE